MLKEKQPYKLMKLTIKLNLLLAIASILSVNAFAWFVYSTRVSNNITAKVKAWRINFESGESEVAEHINFAIGDLYPGMPDYNNVINIVNYSETAANLTYEITGVRILNDVFDVANMTQAEIEEDLANNYPFSIVFTASNILLEPETGSADFEVELVWPFESGDDIVDTFWGNESYDYQQENPGVPGIEITVKLTAVQILD